ncbi:hypothetical protein AL053_03860 [Pseudomonas savastanoi pv. fraxini]|uniref:Uncharacterized protein n=1 Tax=Pseudomonas savastanoi pv. nerii TaxID=360921 RepID=A0AB74BM43_PSESS|nr:MULTISPECIES: hypothetical protein [Pseudomonas]KPB16862.1 hypothetical protein AC519_0623 [Pseudomonas savastanoi]KPY78264.1 hypothetical protein ALO58_200189 [Pseudomonas savastanoi pv. savastanoi]KUG43217.1 Uncharacterized protein ALP79_01950 [Pseudomonas savastanoi pv. fraxini]KWS70031.1 hypothetical protein AL053_03860 [Pseudomonas savastanoi pv. fraxini]RML73993.1 hypothetical protein ALQ90_200380 [Pseudomonas savastanoi pv. savastanoi]
MKYFEWEGAVTEAVSEALAISHSDAVGIVEAQPFYMQQSWGKGMDPQLTAAKIMDAAQADSEELAATPVPRQQRMLFGDEADAHTYWKDKELKVYAVDLIQGRGKKEKVAHTMYVRARTGLGAATCAKENDWSRNLKPRYVARLAGPRELGCTPSKS